MISKSVTIRIECIDKVCHQTKFDTQWWQENMLRIYQRFVETMLHTVFSWNTFSFGQPMLHQVILVRRSAVPEAQEAAIFGETSYYLFRLLFIIRLSQNESVAY